MLTILGRPFRLCDGVTRRGFLTVSAAAWLGLAARLRAEEHSAGRPAHKAVIVVFLPGGPSHIDLFDPKPDTPAEVRGEFRPIRTSVPGVQVSELLPQLARVMDKLALIRSVTGGVDEHASTMCLTGYPTAGPKPAGGWPNVGSVISKLCGPADPAVPPFIALAERMLHPPYNDPGPGFLGAGHAAFSTTQQGQSDLVLTGVTLDGLADRRRLLKSFDTLRRDLDAGSALAGLDVYQRKAVGIVTSSRLRDALDVSREDPRVRDRYGKGTPELVTGFNAAPRLTEQFLVARRLVEAGARCVTLAFGAWDWHEKTIEGLREQAPHLDRGVSALVDDLHDRGLDKDVAVVVWGEFGRSPKINKSAGRDHWPAVSCALLAGGGLKTGQVIGSTTRLGAEAKERPVHFREVIATLYQHAGIDVATAMLPDLSGRPQYLTDDSRPIAELV